MNANFNEYPSYKNSLRPLERGELALELIVQ